MDTPRSMQEAIASHEAAVAAHARTMTRVAIVRSIVATATFVGPQSSNLIAIYRRELDCRGDSA